MKLIFDFRDQLLPTSNMGRQILKRVMRRML